MCANVFKTVRKFQCRTGIALGSFLTRINTTRGQQQSSVGGATLGTPPGSKRSKSGKKDARLAAISVAVSGGALSHHHHLAPPGEGQGGRAGSDAQESKFDGCRLPGLYRHWGQHFSNNHF